MITTMRDPVPAVKYAATMAKCRGEPWGVFKTNANLLVVMPMRGAKQPALEVCNP